MEFENTREYRKMAVLEYIYYANKGEKPKAADTILKYFTRLALRRGSHIITYVLNDVIRSSNQTPKAFLIASGLGLGTVVNYHIRRQNYMSNSSYILTIFENDSLLEISQNSVYYNYFQEICNYHYNGYFYMDFLILLQYQQKLLENRIGGSSGNLYYNLKFLHQELTDIIETAISAGLITYGNADI